ncbi:MAG: hypothetical protein HPY74_20370 [Firmicutes bacterium]|nr:hypothetical protein [Bacillota bacterium]
MTEEETGEIEKIIDESREVDEMVYALEIAIRNMREEMKMQGKMEGRAEGLQEGIEKGRAETKIEVAKNLLGMGMDIR